MKQTLSILLILSLFIFAIRSEAANPRLKELTFQNGERITYITSYALGFLYTDVAEVVVEANKTSDYPEKYHVKGVGKTYRFYDRIFRVRDTYESYFSLPEFKSLYFHRDISEGSYQIKNSYSFDWENRKIKGSVEYKNETEQVSLAMSKGQDFDVLTCFYYFRNIDLEKGGINKIYPISVALDDGVYNIGCQYAGKEQRKIKELGGKVDCIKLNLQVIAGEVFKGHEVITIWVSDDENRIPLEMEFPIRIGKMKVRIQHYENLKTPIKIAE